MHLSTPLGAVRRRRFLKLLALAALLTPLPTLLTNALLGDEPLPLPMAVLTCMPALLLAALMLRARPWYESRWTPVVAGHRARTSARAHRDRPTAPLPDAPEPRNDGCFRALVQNAADVIALVDADGALRYVNTSILHLLGVQPDALTGRRLQDLAHPEDAGRLSALLLEARALPGSSRPLELRLRHHEGAWKHVELVCNNLLEHPDVGCLTVTIRDVSERRARERKLAQLAFRDPLTRLANRELFRDRVLHALTQASRRRTHVAVLYIDLDNFKQINDVHGHAAGDHLLLVVSGRIRTLLRAGDTAARLGGDEFAVLLTSHDGEVDAARVAQRLLEALAEPILWSGERLQTGASIGIASSSGLEHGDASADVLLQSADAAMYQAKREGRGRYVLAEGSRAEISPRPAEIDAKMAHVDVDAMSPRGEVESKASLSLGTWERRTADESGIDLARLAGGAFSDEIRLRGVESRE